MAVFIDIKYRIDTKDLDKANAKLKKAEKTTKSFSNEAAALKKLGKGFLAVAAAAGAVFLATDKALGKLDKIGKSAKNIGLTAEAFQELSHAADLSGVSVDLFQKSMLKLEAAVVKAQKGTLTQVEAFESMGIAISEFDGLEPDQIFDRVADGMSTMESSVRKGAAAMDIFGTRGADMIELLSQGSSKINTMRASARELGLVLSNELVAAAEKNNDKLNTMKAIVDTQWVSVWASWAPTIVNVSQAFADAAVSATNYWTAFQRGLGGGNSVPAGLTEIEQKILGVRRSLAALEETKPNSLNPTVLSDLKNLWLDASSAMGKSVGVGARLRAELAGLLKEQEAINAAQNVPPRTAVEDPFLTTIAERKAAVLSFQDEMAQLLINNLSTEARRVEAQASFEIDQQWRKVKAVEETTEERKQIESDFMVWRTQREIQLANDLEAINKTSLERTADHAIDTQKRMSDVAASSFNKIGDAIGDVVTTGKLDFRSLAKSIIADFVSMIAKALIFNAVKSVFGFGAGGVTNDSGAGSSGDSTSLSGFAKGGMTNGVERFATGGSLGKRGELGQEAIFPLERDNLGRLGIKAGGESGGKVVSISSSVTVNNPQGDGDDVAAKVSRQVESSLRNLVKSEIVEQSRPGNLLNRNVVSAGGF